MWPWCGKSLRAVQRERDYSRTCTGLAIGPTTARKAGRGQGKIEPTDLAGAETSTSSLNPALAMGLLAGTKPGREVSKHSHIPHRSVLRKSSADRVGVGRLAPRVGGSRSPDPTTHEEPVNPAVEQTTRTTVGEAFRRQWTPASGILRPSFGRVASVLRLISFGVLERQIIRFGRLLLRTHISNSNRVGETRAATDAYHCLSRVP